MCFIDSTLFGVSKFFNQKYSICTGSNIVNEVIVDKSLFDLNLQLLLGPHVELSLFINGEAIPLHTIIDWEAVSG